MCMYVCFIVYVCYGDYVCYFTYVGCLCMHVYMDGRADGWIDGRMDECMYDDDDDHDASMYVCMYV